MKQTNCPVSVYSVIHSIYSFRRCGGSSLAEGAFWKASLREGGADEGGGRSKRNEISSIQSVSSIICVTRYRRRYGG